MIRKIFKKYSDTIEVEGLGRVEFDMAFWPDLADGTPVSKGNAGYDDVSQEVVVTEWQKADKIRSERAKRLIDCDWTQINDSPLIAGKKQEWSSYRQALRDITKQSTFPQSVTWPDAPAS